MAVSKSARPSTAIAKVQTPLDSQQILRASKALLKKLKTPSTSNGDAKTSLLADADAEDASDSAAVWLLLTTKKHIVDKKRLKPGKILIPHPYITSESSEEGARICLITADPQRKYKDMIEHPSFPVDTSKSITRVIGLEKLKAKYNSYESKRQLMGEYDVFLADDRIITYLPGVLGKIFYKCSAKRPIPVSLEGRRQTVDEQGNKRRKLSEGGTKVTKTEAKPTDVAAEIEKALASALVHLAPSTSTAVKVGSASMTAEQIQDNVEVVVDKLVETYVPQKWQNVRAIHIKGPNTIALPIWQTDELWTDEKEDVRAEALPAPGKANKKRKRGALTAGEEVLEVPGPDGKMRQVKKQSKAESVAAPVAEDETTKEEKALRKQALKKQKEALANGSEGTLAIEAPAKAEKPAKKTRKKAADLN
ncbi:hypothetical protein AMS68_006396 [Peltaster fructicola]|uniref:Ribosomal protein L1 n=1 Tax=Peltaster fructicola TaxID=286661 RepID=A0A6H0Y1Y1_9PEZI|nr:hypothetical protein AMS68_006396 [Peltaster fructicola]